MTRCAVYTRQSAASDDDLSSCDVQYEICSAYVRSQRSEGWHLVGERFDDNGFLGATHDRPALTRLRELVRKREIDAVVIHRMDRLARSLLGARFSTCARSVLCLTTWNTGFRIMQVSWEGHAAFGMEMSRRPRSPALSRNRLTFF